MTSISRKGIIFQKSLADFCSHLIAQYCVTRLCFAAKKARKRAPKHNWVLWVRKRGEGRYQSPVSSVCCRALCPPSPRPALDPLDSPHISQLGGSSPVRKWEVEWGRVQEKLFSAICTSFPILSVLHCSAACGLKKKCGVFSLGLLLKISKVMGPRLSSWGQGATNTGSQKAKQLIFYVSSCSICVGKRMMYIWMMRKSWEFVFISFCLYF